MVQRADAVPLWDGDPPGSENWNQQEREWVPPYPGAPTMLRNVVRPTVTPVLPDPSIATGTAVVVCPGGAYSMLAMTHEGFDVARWLAARGIAAFVCKYRVMETPESDEAMTRAMAEAMSPGLSEILRQLDEFAAIPLADGVAACNLVRDRAGEWGVRADRVGALGFSAGGRLVLDLASHDEHDARPAFVGAIYPAGTARPVPADAPPLFVAAAVDDPLFDESVRTHAAWRQAGRPVEAHFYAHGGHGFGLIELGLPADQWIEQFREWMTAEGF
jgi:acetyl esterase/lipase